MHIPNAAPWLNRLYLVSWAANFTRTTFSNLPAAMERLTQTGDWPPSGDLAVLVPHQASPSLAEQTSALLLSLARLSQISVAPQGSPTPQWAQFFPSPCSCLLLPVGVPTPITQRETDPEGVVEPCPRSVAQSGPPKGTSSSMHALRELRYLGLLTVIEGTLLNWDFSHTGKTIELSSSHFSHSGSDLAIPPPNIDPDNMTLPST